MTDDNKENEVGKVFVGLATAKAALSLIGGGMLIGAMSGVAFAGGFAFVPMLVGAALGGLGAVAIGHAYMPQNVAATATEKPRASAAPSTAETSPAPDRAMTHHRERVIAEANESPGQTR